MEPFSHGYYKISYSEYFIIPLWKDIIYEFDEIIDSSGRVATSAQFFTKREAES